MYVKEKFNLKSQVLEVSINRPQLFHFIFSYSSFYFLKTLNFLFQSSTLRSVVLRRVTGPKVKKWMLEVESIVVLNMLPSYSRRQTIFSEQDTHFSLMEICQQEFIDTSFSVCCRLSFPAAAILPTGVFDMRSKLT